MKSHGSWLIRLPRWGFDSGVMNVAAAASIACEALCNKNAPRRRDTRLTCRPKASVKAGREAKAGSTSDAERVQRAREPRAFVVFWTSGELKSSQRLLAPEIRDGDQKFEVYAHRISDRGVREDILQLHEAQLAQSHAVPANLQHVVRNRRARHQSLQHSISPGRREAGHHSAKTHPAEKLSDLSPVERDLGPCAVARHGQGGRIAAVDGYREFPKARERWFGGVF